MKKILLLEDDESLNRGISLKLSTEGYQVLSAYTMQEAKSMFEKEAIDLVISVITKPFSVNILVSKVNAFMRRIHETGKEILLSEGIEVSIKEMQVKKSGVSVSLSKTELQLLIYLLENAGRILSKENILERVWGLDGQFVDDNTVAVNISRLKNKLGTECIANVRGLGYLWTGKVEKK